MGDKNNIKPPAYHRVTKEEIALMNVMDDRGSPVSIIAEELDRNYTTVTRVLKNTKYLSDPKIQKMIATMQQDEAEDLALIGIKGRQRMHKLLDDEATNPIETTAMVDRVFQQRRLLEDKSTANISIRVLDGDAEELQARIDRLEKGKG